MRFEVVRNTMVAAGSAAALAIGVEAAVTTPPEVITGHATAAPKNYIRPCYDQALDLPAQPEVPSDITLPVDDDGRIEAAYAKPTPDVVQKLAEGIVRVSVNEDLRQGQTGGGPQYGSGFAMEYNGKMFIVTAAHVTGGSPVEAITVTANNGSTARATKGCSIYENNNQQLSVESPRVESVDTDVAVFELDRPLDVVPLELADTPPMPGTSGYTMNYQLEHMPGDPTEYPVLITNDFPGLGLYGETALEVLGENATPGTVSASGASPGASGAPIIDIKTGEVTAVLTGSQGTSEGAAQRDSLETLAERGVKFTGSKGRRLLQADKGWLPGLTRMQHAATVQTALDSPRS